MEEVTGLDREVESLSGAMKRINKYILEDPEHLTRLYPALC